MIDGVLSHVEVLPRDIWGTKGVETLTSAAAEKMLLEQHLNAARAANYCSSSIIAARAVSRCCSTSKFLPEQHYFLLQQKNPARPAFIFRISP
ncbi:hypothetical protein DPMN_001041 [Dreissena polymorpha]|uniref:Uncharacterized protein n=1 Tax=Dreissena polymorpha TaxID=45954 RepID=A0A9D4MKY8_DREPO|nr:hypothetical protein DPMN_001041 [Dreissena polymorpha]